MSLAEELKVEVLTKGDIATAMAGMDEYQQAELGRKTFLFVKRLLRDPEMRKKHTEMKERLRAEGYFDRCSVPAGD